MKPVVLIGGGGHCRSVIDVAERLSVPLRGILDLPDLLGQLVMSTEVVGNDNDIPRFAADSAFIVTLGAIKDPSRRIALHKLLAELGAELASIVSPQAYVSENATVGFGTVVLNFANINAGATVGEGCIVNSMADIEHDAVVGDYCHISTGAIVNGGARIGEGTFIGSGAVIANGVSVAPHTVVGAGAIVIEDITEPGTYAGCPAKKI